MARWLALILAAVVAGLAGAATTPESHGASEQLVPTQPWPLPAGADVKPASSPTEVPVVPPPSSSLPTAPPSAQAGNHKALGTRDVPAVDVVGTRWYEDQTTEPPLDSARLYLDRMINGEVVEGWNYEAGFRVEDAAARLETGPTDESLNFGVESKLAQTTAVSEHGDFINAVLVGPSMNWQPSEHTQFEFAPLVGVSTPYPMSEVFVAFSWKF